MDEEISRRALLGAGALGVGTGVLAGCLPEPTHGGRPIPVKAKQSPDGKRPNILVILSDDHRWDHMSFHPGHPDFLSTPALDSLAERGVVGTNFFVTTALCSPSRASFLTGQYATRHGVRNNMSAWRAGNRTFFENVQAAGYRTAYIGKWHMPGGVPDLVGLDRFITFTTSGGQGVYEDCPLLIDGVMTPRPNTYISTDLTDLSLEWLDSVGDQPWCLFLAHKAVHHDFIPPKDLAGSLAEADLGHLPREAFDFLSLLDTNIWEGTRGTLHGMYRRYCETLLGLDREIGRLLAHLETSGQTDRTHVVYTSDNGYSWGEHVLTGKRWPYEENTRVPFIAAGPGIPANQTDRLMLNVDLAATVSQWAGVEPPPGSMGRSMAPVLEGRLESRPDGWRRDFMYEYFLDYPHLVPGLQSVRDDQLALRRVRQGPGPRALRRDRRSGLPA